MDLEPLKIDRSQVKTRRKSAGFSYGKLVLLGLLLFFCWFFRKPLVGYYESVNLPKVKVAKVIRRSPSTGGAVRGAAANGYVVARTRAALSADTPGRITELLVEEGSVVMEGDLVARLYDDEYQAALERAEADLEFAKAAHKKSLATDAAAASEVERLKSVVAANQAKLEEARAQGLLAEQNYKRFKRLVETGVERRQLLDEAQESLDGRRARVVSMEAVLAASEANVIQGRKRKDIAAAATEESAAQVDVMMAVRDERKATLDKTEVRAPFSGVVVLKDAEVGEVVSPNSQGGSSRGSVVTMVDFDSLEVQADVPETSLSAVRLGGAAKVFLDAYPEHPYEGRVARIWPTADKKKATVEVRVTIAELDGRLRPEMGVRVVFVAEEQEAQAEEGIDEDLVLLQVSEACVAQLEGRIGAFVLEGDVVQFKPVVFGEARSGKISVEKGLEVGQRVVVEPPPGLESGERVRIEGGR